MLPFSPWGCDGRVPGGVKVEGKAHGSLPVEIGRHLKLGNLLQQELESRPAVELTGDLIGLDKALQEQGKILG